MLERYIFFVFFVGFLALFSERSQAQLRADSSGESANRVLITTNVGKIMEDYLTSREVNIAYFIEKNLFQDRKESPIKSFYPMDSKEFNREVTAVLIEQAIYQDSKDLPEMKWTHQEVDKMLRFFKKKAFQDRLWNSLSVDEEELKEALKKKIQSKKYIQFKMNSAKVLVSDEEVRSYFEGNRSEFGELPYAQFKESIRAFLKKQQVQKRLKDWFDLLQSKYKIRNLIADTL